MSSPKALIIGAAGFVGGYLVQHLAGQLGWQVDVTALPGEKTDDSGVHQRYDVDILQPQQIADTLQHSKPQYVFHLAAQSSVGLSWQKPALTIDINIKGTLNVLEAIRQAGPDIRVLLPGSSEEYGYLQPQDIPVKEDTLPRPGNLYAVTKNAQNQMAGVYARAYQMQLVSTRSFNHIGPRQGTGFVVPDFCKQIAEIEAGKQPPVLQVGNLEAQRDFCDVRDIVAAYALLVQKGQAGQTYNVGSGQAVSVQHILNVLLGMAKVPITTRQNPARMRPSDVPVIQADIKKLQATVPWAPQYTLTDTLQETLDYWRAQTV